MRILITFAGDRRWRLTLGSKTRTCRGLAIRVPSVGRLKGAGAYLEVDGVLDLQGSTATIRPRKRR